MPGSKMTVTPRFYVLIAATLIVVPLPWLLGWLLAAVIHELCHYAALLFCKAPIYHVEIDVQGAVIETSGLTWGQAVICALAGPAGGLILLAGSNVFPRVAVCALLQSVYNLLPVYPLDGGRALHGVLTGLLSVSAADLVCTIVGYFTILSVLVLCCCAAFAWNLGYLPLFFGLAFCVRAMRAKIPCK